MSKSGYFLTIVALLCTTPAAFGETALEVVDHALEKTNSLSSFKIKKTNAMRLSIMETDSVSTTWAEKHGEVWKVRMVLDKTERTYVGKGAERKVDEENKTTSIIVSDGKEAMAEQDVMGKKVVLQMPAFKPTKEIEELKRSLEAKGTTAEVLEDEEVNGENCAVIRMVSSFGEVDSTMTAWISEATGLVMKFESVGPESSTKSTAEHETGTDIDDNLFKYTPPQGAKVMKLPMKF